MVDIARAGGVDAQQADAEHLPFDDSEFDAVVAGYLLNHLPRPEAAVAEMARVLVPGGRLAVTVWDVPARNPAMGLFGPIVTNLGLSGVVPTGPDAQRFSDETQVRALLRRWNDVRVEAVRWTVSVEPGAWFDAIADSTPRTGAVLAQAGAELRSVARERYVELAAATHPVRDGRVELPAGAVLISGSRATASV